MKPESKRVVAATLTVDNDKREAAILSADTLAESGNMTLVAAAKLGSREAFEILVERHERRIFCFALRITRNRQDAEDVVQQSLQKAFTHLRKFEEKSSFSTWLTSIAFNEARMLLRKSRGAREVSIEDPAGNEETAFGTEIPDSGPGPEDSYSRRERQRILLAAMNRLTPGVRKAIELREIGELSTQETARAMGLSVGAVKARVFHGRRKLRERLSHCVRSAWTSGKDSSRRIHNTRNVSQDPVLPAMRVVNAGTRDPF
jgi:RNA polymerase sigma-70 factor (ECF subfamily)